MNIVNLTPHAVTVQHEDGTVTEIPPSGTVARVEAAQVPIGDVDGITVVRSTFGPPTDLPDPAEGVVYLVSSLVAQAVPDREDVVAPDTGATCVRNENGRIVAVRRFQRF
jgi:hypothetical protein